MIDFADGIPSPNLLRLQAVQQDLAAKLMEFCQSRGLHPFLVAGSALGAWRESGMIAWDDDIDLGMLREDYEALIDAWEIDPLPGISLQSWRSEPGYPFAFAKLRLDGTQIDETASLGKRFHQGIFIDIFPFDPLPRSALWRGLQYAVLLGSNLFVMSFSREAALAATQPTFRRLRLAAWAVRPIIPVRALIALREWAFRMPFAAKSDWFVSFQMYGIRFARRTRIGRQALVPPVMLPFGPHEFPVPRRLFDGHLRKLS